eukprot:1159348-Pelagomonas_calceolata.AAC.1
MQIPRTWQGSCKGREEGTREDGLLVPPTPVVLLGGWGAAASAEDGGPWGKADAWMLATMPGQPSPASSLGVGAALVAPLAVLLGDGVVFVRCDGALEWPSPGWEGGEGATVACKRSLWGGVALRADVGGGGQRRVRCRGGGKA